MTRYNTKPCKCGAVTSVLATDTGRAVLQPKLGWVRLYITEKGVELAMDNGRLRVPCRACGVIRYARRVEGKVSTKHTCGAKCTSSMGFVCECSCGGQNHGAGFAS